MHLFCCWSRSDPPDENPASGPRDHQVASSGSPSPETPLQVSNTGGVVFEFEAGIDGEKFDKAVKNNDLGALVELLDSEQKISCLKSFHAWAENPQTIGTLAGTQLALLAQGTPKVEIGKAGAIPKFVDLLKSEKSDRVQTAVVALCFLTTECPVNINTAYEAGAMPLLLKCMDANLVELRAAAATALRNICMEKPAYLRKFMELGGLTGLVNQIGCPSSELSSRGVVQWELVLNLQDFLDAHDGSLLVEAGKIAIGAGIVNKLEGLLATEDREFHSTVEEVLDSLSSVNVDEVNAAAAANAPAVTDVIEVEQSRSGKTTPDIRSTAMKPD
eukprot:TRINITY_DN45925_c0_g1_i1.p1 TRINITY_DN45925_c0_g1~~TRINITY_DN45925_c0_g1_i1.p1  ORF type:complete len:331 (-),score=51.38 TRINITY_DN45925_c0_g1_i1:134-1126(-)